MLEMTSVQKKNWKKVDTPKNKTTLKDKKISVLKQKTEDISKKNEQGKIEINQYIEKGKKLLETVQENTTSTSQNLRTQSLSLIDGNSKIYERSNTLEQEVEKLQKMLEDETVYKTKISEILIDMLNTIEEISKTTTIITTCLSKMNFDLGNNSHDHDEEIINNFNDDRDGDGDYDNDKSNDNDANE